MMRCALSSAPTALTAAFAEQRRTMKMSTLNETMKPIPGQTAGTLNVMNEISVNPDADEERKRPAWRREVYPKQSEHSYLATMYKWGYNSLSLFKKVNEDPGQWWNANSSTLTSNWAQIGDYAAAGMWSGVWRFTYGLGQYNLTPCQARQNAYGRKDKNGALTIDYKESLTAVENYVSPHLPEHQKHRRFKNPELPGFATMEQVKTKRTEREVQYHLGQGLRMYLVDGFLGSHPSTSTSFRVITDNADHAYAITMYANRQNNIHSFREMPLLKRVGTSPMDEWSWRRPGVVLLHAPGYSFEAPRVVEEFGGPRPQDLGLVTPKFRLVDPYSIPMKAYLGAVPETSAVIDTLGFLCSRWAFYADDKEHLTLIGDSVASADGQSVTIVVDATGKADTTALRRSPFVYGSRHHRLADGLFTRGWDAVSQPLAENKTHELDFVETSLNVLHRPLSTVINAPAGVNAFSHRFYNKRRSIANFGFKRSHNHTADPTQRAASAGMLFNAPKSNIVRRPAAFHAAAVKVVVIEEKGGAAKPLDNKAASEAVVASLEATGLLYAEADKLAAAFAIALSHTAGATSVGPNEAKALIAKLSQSGTA